MVDLEIAFWIAVLFLVLGGIPVMHVLERRGWFE